MGKIADPSEVWLELGLSGSITDEERAVVQAMIARAEGAVKRFLRYDPVLATRTEFYPRTDLSGGSRQYVWEASDTEAYVRQLADGEASELQLLRLPVRSSPAMEVRIDYDGRSGRRSGAFGADTIKVEGSDYWANFDMVDSDGNSVCSDGVLRSVGLWPLAPGTVRVTYSGGYSNGELHGTAADVNGDVPIDASPILAVVIEEAKRRVEKIMARKKSSAVGWTAGPVVSESLGDYSYSIDSSLASKLYGDQMQLSDESKEALQTFVNMSFCV